MKLLLYRCCIWRDAGTSVAFLFVSIAHPTTNDHATATKQPSYYQTHEDTNIDTSLFGRTLDVNVAEEACAAIDSVHARFLLALHACVAAACRAMIIAVKVRRQLGRIVEVCCTQCYVFVTFPFNYMQ